MSVQVPPDSTGKIVRTKTDSGTQEQQVVTIGNGTDGVNVAALTDMDSGAGTEQALNVSLRKSANGGSVEYGTSTNPLRVDPTGTTIQPVSGTVAATQSGSWTVQSSSSTTANSPAQISQGTTAALILSANASRKQVIVQNTGTTAIKLGLGQTPTQTAYHIALKACSTNDDGTGGTFVSDCWTGAISAISSIAGGTLVVTELT